MFILDQQSSIASQFLAEIRDVKIQNDTLRFRENMRKLGTLLAYEISKKLDYRTETIQTPLTNAVVNVLDEDLVIMSILRAALPFSHGFQDLFEKASFGFVGAGRKAQKSDDEVEIALDYLATPDLNNKTLILVDPMLATGKSMVKSIDQLLKNGSPKFIHIACTIAAPEGIRYLKEHLNTPYDLWSCAVDEKLNEKYYLVPGLGDAGDLAFGEKL